MKAGRTRALIALAAAALAACALPDVYSKAPPTVVFLTDFGVKDDSVALCKGVMWSVAPSLRIVDLTHDVPPFDVRAAGRLIAGTAPYYPAGTVFVAVVDPGVGSARRALAVLTKKEKFYVGPDNGVFDAVIEQEGLQEAREITNAAYMRKGPRSSTFHGRDIFSPAAAYLADHAPFEEIGPVVADLVHLPPAPKAAFADGELKGEVDFIEAPYGNVITDIPQSLVGEAAFKPGDALVVALYATPDAAPRLLPMPYENTFSDVAAGKPVALLSSRGRLSFSINQGDFAAREAVTAGMSVRVRRAPGAPR